MDNEKKIWKTDDMRRINQRLEEMNSNWAELAKHLGGKSQHTSNWKQRNGIPKHALTRTARFINRSVEWILDGTGEVILSDHQQKLLALAEGLSPAKQEAVILLLESLYDLPGAEVKEVTRAGKKRSKR